MMTAEELNAHIADGTINDVIRVAEARHVKHLSGIADKITADDRIRLVLVTGASAAGKTTTAKRICTQLMVNDRPAALHLSTDDYFVGDARNPRDANGNLDYEHVECVDIPQLSSDVKALLRGESVRRRRFDFIRHAPSYDGSTIRLPEGGMVVLEGIHALNPRLTEGLDEALKYRVFIDPVPNLDVFGGFVPSSQHARLLRRMVRDNQYRKRKPSETILKWPSVMDGERKWIDPFRSRANATFNSYLVYEMAALKGFVGGLLALAERDLGEHPIIMKLIAMLQTVDRIPPTVIPGDSILRETIGGSQLEY